PSYTEQPLRFFSQVSTPVRDRPDTRSFRAFTAFMSTAISHGIFTPKSDARRAMWAAYALATTVFVGMQPVLTQVPPKNFRSITPTVRPESTRRCASAGPAWPVPMMMASKFCIWIARRFHEVPEKRKLFRSLHDLRVRLVQNDALMRIEPFLP